MKNFLASFFILIFFFNAISLALSPEDKLPNEAEESRAINLFLEIRCLVCQGQVIENSDTQFAHDIRKFVRKKISQGLTNDEIKAQLIKNFGDEILQTPTLKSQPVLWILPLFFFVLTLFFIKYQYHKIHKNDNLSS
jgi:cytochrome c-type biogenesis protein CcmH